MKKLTLKISAFVFFIFLAGCSELMQAASQYALSESMVNRYLQGYLGQEKSFNAAGLANASLSFNNLNADIGREDPNKVSLSGSAKFGISSILGAQSAEVSLKMKARPVYDSSKGAIYLKDLELSDYKLDSTLGSVGASTLLPYLNKALQFYFNEQPVYVLSSGNNPLEAVVLKLGSDIMVEQGQIVFPFAQGASAAK